MPVPAPKGLALTGSIISIVIGALLLIGGVLAAAEGRREEGVIIGIVAGLLGVTAIVLGSIGCTIKPGVILANAIVFSVMTVLALMGLVLVRPNPILIISLLLYATTTTFLYIGYAQARRYQEAQRNG